MYIDGRLGRHNSLGEEEAICDATSNQKQQAPRLRESIDSLRPPLAIVTDGRTFNFHGAAILFGTYREKTPWNRAVHEIVVYCFCMCVCVCLSLCGLETTLTYSGCSVIYVLLPPYTGLGRRIMHIHERSLDA